MSHTTRIGVSKELEDIFVASRIESNYRCLQIKIVNEQLVLSNSYEINDKKWEDEYNKIVEPLVVGDECCYILYNISIDKNEWIFMSYIPDFANYKDKMIYAATRSNVKDAFGTNLIKTNIEGAKQCELNLLGYKHHLESEAAPPPLSRSEIEKAELKSLELNSHISVTTKSATLPGLSFPLTEQALMGLDRFLSEENEYVHLMVNCENENIGLVSEGRINFIQMSESRDQAHYGYHLLHYQHDFNGERFNNTIFVYVMPGFKASIKERMLFTSCKAPFLDYVESTHKFSFDKKLEVDDICTINEEYLKNELHPPEITPKVAFARPKPPGRR